jgi:hypothetical protein
MKPLLLGMARNDDLRGKALLPSEDGGNGAGDRLLRISGLTREEYLKKFRRRNILPAGRWSASRARLRGYRLQRRLRGRVIVLGKDTWRALWLPRVEFFGRVINGDECVFILIPHPSGRNLIYNDLDVRLKARKILRGDL